MSRDLWFAKIIFLRTTFLKFDALCDRKKNENECGFKGTIGVETAKNKKRKD